MSLQSGAFLATIVFHVGLLVSSDFSHHILRSTMAIGCVSIVSFFASFMTLCWNWGGVCEDAFG